MPDISNEKQVRTLFITCVGSHMWRMNAEDSDVDLAITYIAPTRAILRGEPISHTIGQQKSIRNGIVYDTMGWEVGHLINQLLKGNINAIWYATSPIVPQRSVCQEELKYLIENNLCRNTYYSLAGMADIQIKEGQKQNGSGSKGFMTALRTMNFGVELLSRGRLCYSPVRYIPELDEVEERKRRLLDAYKSSHMPDLPDKEVFREFLYKLRMADMDC